MKIKEISTGVRPALPKLLQQSTERMLERAKKLAAERLAAERRGDAVAVRRIKIAEQSLSIRGGLLREAIQTAERSR